MNHDVIIVGAGIVGLSSAWKLARKYPDMNITVLEKEDHVAAHQTGNNSGVIHSGIYYKPNSYRARNCVDGRHQLVDFCEEHGVDYEICGKVIVATAEEEIPRMEKIYHTGTVNGIEGIRIIDADEIREVEPYVRGLKAIHVPCSGIVDFAGMCEKLRELLEERGQQVLLGQEVRDVHRRNGDLEVRTGSDTFRSKYLVNCAGLHSDHVAESAGISTDVQIVPFRGEYYELREHARNMVNGLVYPIPDPDFPFLGVHFTKMVLGGVECGPNAVLAFKREGYARTSFDLEDTIETVNFPGFWKLASRHWRKGMDELYRSFSKRAFVRGLQKLIPSIEAKDLEAAPAGVRAMAMLPDGSILDDFRFEQSRQEIHVLNAPSPAATAGLAIGDEIVRRAQQAFGL